MTRTDRTRISFSERHLSIAVGLRDAYTGRRPKGTPTVALADRPEQFTRNPSGYFVLTDLPADVTSVTIKIDPGERYLPERHVLTEDALADRPQIVDVDLLPAPSYPFPADATLLRGAVGEAADDGLSATLPGVELEVRTTPADDAGDDDTTVLGRGRSTDRGEYVVSFRGLSSDTVAAQYDDEALARIDAANDDGPADGPAGRVVSVDGDLPVVHASDPESDRQVTTSVGVWVGKTTSLDVAF